MNTIGNNIKLTSYGESHGPSVGAILDGLPSNFKIDRSYIQKQLDRRKPGQSSITTTRKEDDDFEITSGLFDDTTTGAPIHFTIGNRNVRSQDYDHLKDVYRPNHADFTYQKKYGIRDFRGGGRSSARVTAGWVAGGALVQDFISKKHNVRISAYVRSIGKVTMENVPRYYDVNEVDVSIVRCPDVVSASQMMEEISNAQAEKDSLGGVVECVINGMPAGVGDPVFRKLSAQLALAMMSINATKGFEIGGGFEMTKYRGSQINDSFSANKGKVITETNHSGGVQGGISNGMDIVFRVAFKPTATIGIEQNTINSLGEEVLLEAKGRHDPCVLPRAVPIVETMAALVLGDFLV